MVRPSAMEIQPYGAADARAALPRHDVGDHKYTRGTLVVAGGSRRYSGAPMLAATAGLHAGAGVVVACIPNSAELFCAVPQALIVHRLPCEESAGVFSGVTAESFRLETKKATALVVGPGMDNHPALDVFLAGVLSLPLPMVADADALNRIAAAPSLLPASSRCSRIVLTPHQGEYARLARAFDIEAGALTREAQALELSHRTGCVVLLKGPRTLVATPEGSLTANESGNPRLATAGSGDVLSGTIGALLAQGVAPALAARLGAYLHGRAADEMEAFIADDLPRAIAKVMATGLY